MANKPKYLTDPQTFNKEWERLVALRDETKKRLEEVNGLIETLEESSSLPDEVEQNLTELRSEASNLQTLLTSSQTYANSIENYYTTWSQTKDKIDSELEEAESQNETLKTYIKETNALKTKLTDELSRSEALLNDARNTLDLVTDGSLSTVFNRRSEDRKKARRGWTWAVVGAAALFVVAVLLAVFAVANDIKDGNQISVWVLKIVLVSPFVYILYFVTRQYSHERDLEEKYAFKSLISQTIQNNTKLLKDEFLSRDDADPEVERKIIDFTVKSLDLVYKEPFNSSSLESKMKFSLHKPEAEAEVRQKGEL